MCGAICRRGYDYAAGSVAQSSAAQSGNVGERAPHHNRALRIARHAHAPRSAVSRSHPRRRRRRPRGRREDAPHAHLPRAVAHLAIARRAPVLACGARCAHRTSGGGRPGGRAADAPNRQARARTVPGSRGRWLPAVPAPVTSSNAASACCFASLLPRPSVWLSADLGLGLPLASAAAALASAAAALASAAAATFASVSVPRRPRRPSARPPRPGPRCRHLSGSGGRRRRRWPR